MICCKLWELGPGVDFCRRGVGDSDELGDFVSLLSSFYKALLFGEQVGYRVVAIRSPTLLIRGKYQKLWELGVNDYDNKKAIPSASACTVKPVYNESGYNER